MQQGWKHWLSGLAAVSVPALLMLVQPSLELLDRNPEYFLSDLKTLLPFVQIAALYIASGLVLFLLRNRSKSCMAGLFAYLLLAPLWIAYRMFDDAARESFYVLPLVALVGGFLLARVRWRESVISGFAIYGGILLVGCVAKLVPLVAAPEHPSLNIVANHASPTPVVSEKPDVYHIVFDEFQSDLFADILNEEVKQSLAGFTWFQNATTPFGRTEMALSSLFTGIPYDYKQTPSAYIKEAFYGEKSLLSRLKREGYRKIGYLHQIYPPTEKEPAFETAFFHRDLGGALTLADRQRLMVHLWMYNALPPEIYKKLIPEFQLDQLESQTLLPNDAPYISLQSFHAFLNAERDSKDHGGRYLFVHLILPHFPTVLRSDCGYAQGEKTNIRQQTQCAVRLMGELVEMLKATGRFKNALIFLHGDHGARYVMRDGQITEAKDRFYGHDFSLGRSRPMVLVKPAGVDATAPLVTDTRLTDLLDYYPTVLDAVGLKPETPLVGHSWTEPAPATPRARVYHFYDKDKSGKKQIVDGPIHRYNILPDGEIAADKEIIVPLQ